VLMDLSRLDPTQGAYMELRRAEIVALMIQMEVTMRFF
jgi:hypothetical protein